MCNFRFVFFSLEGLGLSAVVGSFRVKAKTGLLSCLKTFCSHIFLPSAYYLKFMLKRTRCINDFALTV